MAELKHLAQRLGYQLAGRLAVKRMKPRDDVERQVGAAIARVLQGQLAQDEVFWQESIESLRRQMARDDTVLSYTDYGARSVEPARTSRTIAEVQSYSVPPHQGLALHVLVRDLRPEVCLELGTCLGVSSAYIASALDLNEHGSLTTLEGGKDLSRVASINFSRLGLRKTRFVTGPFSELLPAVLPEIGPVELAYVDGHHDGDATTRYFDTIVRHSASRAVIVMDDIRWSRDMREAWRTIRGHPRVAATLDLLSFGVCITGPAEAQPNNRQQHA